ncbi:hypoxanthine-guanine-xanthine phosphoribosyltransferase-like isoform X2 [Hylaeus volcanicus]|uniref:hypoxanthine-guanine-xanthine phosphoribosyltransferase-like isoform X2 n=1 Tax=Hylaeus volcanicus TaxID=313075 RepID=UPI0023B7BCBE|nr:hypoxanthine-guanine-xanthine phosphoribosyltransferase-like isoform X2 [Hylaeus volcanicus]
MIENGSRIVTNGKPIWIDDKGYPKEAFLLPFHYEKDISLVLIPKGIILDRIEKMAYNISNFYRNKHVHLVCILKGSRAYFNHLLNTLNKIYLYNYNANETTPYLEHYVRVKSYENETSLGKITIVSDDLSALKGQNVLIVEDLIDTGLTLKKLCEWLEENVKPRHIGITCLLEKSTSVNYSSD